MVIIYRSLPEVEFIDQLNLTDPGSGRDLIC
jgi:hypothetical protein